MRLEDEIRQTKGFRNPLERTLVNIHFTSRWLEGLQAEFMRPHDLTIQQYNILRILRGAHPEPVTVKTLRERMLDKMSDTSRLVEKLRKKGMISRKLCKSDRRNVDVTITEKGIATLSEIDHAFTGLYRKLEVLPEKEIILLGELLDRIRG
ncbi:MAG: MarR family transcriptional regulator [Bacteroidia bacterium]|nr:MarR family transcriptional regulator [Bacteroidia bacterium]